MIKLAQILMLLLPIARDIVKATKPKSPGGKRITVDELVAILLRRADDLVDDINKAA